MPNAPHNQTDRRDAIRTLLKNRPAATQRSLVEALTERGFAATQSSVSRDLREIGALKTATGYRLPTTDADADGHDEVAQVAELLRRLTPAGPHLLVVHTATGAAQRVALALDRCGWLEIIGNVGGDDTVFTATANAAAQRNVIARIEQALHAPVPHATEPPRSFL